MLMKLAPSAVTPPSANKKHWTNKTAAITTAPDHGPSSTDASTPPSRWPEHEADRKIDHLSREDKGRHRAHQHGRPLAELLLMSSECNTRARPRPRGP